MLVLLCLCRFPYGLYFLKLIWVKLFMCSVFFCFLYCHSTVYIFHQSPTSPAFLSLPSSLHPPMIELFLILFLKYCVCFLFGWTVSHLHFSGVVELFLIFIELFLIFTSVVWLNCISDYTVCGWTVSHLHWTVFQIIQCVVELFLIFIELFFRLYSVWLNCFSWIVMCKAYLDCTVCGSGVVRENTWQRSSSLYVLLTTVNFSCISNNVAERELWWLIIYEEGSAYHACTYSIQ